MAYLEINSYFKIQEFITILESYVLQLSNASF